MVREQLDEEVVQPAAEPFSPGAAQPVPAPLADGDLGGGPVAAGVLSDAFKPSFGVQSLRYALMLTTSTLPWSALHFYLGSRSLMRDKVD